MHIQVDEIVLDDVMEIGCYEYEVDAAESQLGYAEEDVYYVPRKKYLQLIEQFILKVI